MGYPFPRRLTINPENRVQFLLGMHDHGLIQTLLHFKLRNYCINRQKLKIAQ